ncbi:type II toxin-antitoxin system PemK/MazF family toxin [Paludibaculum fermentans]|uniref:type II toxin-antitoxin system PemK/MazF family toxin n=1 Tax=Paludibaculum fermentans TaxID=1473598 RepID=UPI003EC1494E
MATPRQRGGSSKVRYPKRGEIYLTTLDPTVGREIKKTRPALVIQNDISNRLTGLTIVAPITSTVRFPINPVHVLLPADDRTGLQLTSAALLNQIRAVDRSRLSQRIGMADAETMMQVDEAIKVSLGLLEF